MIKFFISLFKKTVHWAWTRDEIHQETSWNQVLFSTLMYGALFILVILTGVVLVYLGHRTIAYGFWLFGISFTGFMGAINIVWDVLNYRQDQQAEPAPETDAPGPQRELAPDFQLSDDARFGFIVTVIGLVVLVLSFELAEVLNSIV